MPAAVKHVLETPFLRRILGNTGWQIADKVLRMVVGLFVGVWIARHLGPHDFGTLNFAIAFVALFSFLSDVGLQSVLVRELVRRPNERAQILASGLALRVIGSVIAIVLATACIFITRPDEALVQGTVVIIALGLLAQAWDVVDYDFQSRMHPVPVVTIRAISLLVFSTIKVLLIVNDAGVQAFAWATSGELALSALLLWGITSRQGVPFTLAGVRREEMKELLRSSWPLAISSLSVILYMRTDQVMLGQLLDDRAVGVFSAAVRISESWYFVPMAMLTAVAPALTAAHNASEEDYRARLLTSIRLIVWASILLAACIMLASGPIVSVLFGPEYEQAKTVLAIHAWAGVFAGLGVASSPWFVNAGLLGLRMTFTIAGALMNIGLNAVAIPRFGVYGAAVVTLLSYAVSGFLLNAITSRTRPVFFMQLRALFLR